MSGGVTFELGQKDLSPPTAEPLIRALSLHSRSTHVLLPGQGADAPVDGSFGEASVEGALPPILTVPIDAIPVLQFEMRPNVPDGTTVLGTPISSLLAATDWVRRGERFYRYQLQNVTLTPQGGGASVQPGDTPVVWWDRAAHPASADDSDVQLALLDWIPDPTPVAALRTETRDEQITNRWGTICDDVAPATGVLWTFIGQPVGRQTNGWALQGLPFPDKPGQVRSSPPDRVMKVTEVWRTGTLLDAFLDVAPGEVLGMAGKAARYLKAPKTGNPIAPVVTDNDFVNQLLAETPLPELDRLQDSVRLDVGSDVVEIRGLVTTYPEEGYVVVRCIDANGQAIKDFQVLDGMSHPLPDHWVRDPWKPIVASLTSFIGDDYPAFFNITDVPEGTAAVHIGMIYARLGLQAEQQSLWGLVAVEMVTAAEVARRDWDENAQKTQKTVIDGALGADQSNRALLFPDTTYTVSVDYAVTTANADDKGILDPSTVSTAQGPSQVFHFQTDKGPPTRLDARVIATSPADGEECFFTSDPVRIVFSSGETRKLYSAYGKTLHAVVRSASGKHPSSTDGLADGIFLLNRATVIPTLAMSPFEHAARDVVDALPCVDLTVDNSRHEVVTVPLTLTASTGYTFDIEAWDSSASSPGPLGSSPYPLFRRSFRTSRYASAAAMAADILAHGTRHRYLADSAGLTSLGPAVVPDIAFEAALRGSGWGDFGRLTIPRTTVIWTGSAGVPSQPVAVFIESVESCWRERQVPVLPDVPMNGVVAYTYGAQSWLSVQDLGGTVARFVHSSSGTRTLAILKPSVAGQETVLGLQRTPHPMFEGAGPPPLAAHMVDALLHAPWEVVA